MKLSTSDYKKILKFYKLSIPKKSKNIKNKADKIIAKKFCSCIKKVQQKFKKEGIAIGICTKSVITKKGYKRGKFRCKKRRTIKLQKGGGGCLSRRCRRDSPDNMDELILTGQRNALTSSQEAEFQAGVEVRRAAQELRTALTGAKLRQRHLPSTPKSKRTQGGKRRRKTRKKRGGMKKSSNNNTKKSNKPNNLKVDTKLKENLKDTVAYSPHNQQKLENPLVRNNEGNLPVSLVITDASDKDPFKDVMGGKRRRRTRKKRSGMKKTKADTSIEAVRERLKKVAMNIDKAKKNIQSTSYKQKLRTSPIIHLKKGSLTKEEEALQNEMNRISPIDSNLIYKPLLKFIKKPVKIESKKSKGGKRRRRRKKK